MFWNGPYFICSFDVLLSFCHDPCCITSHHVATSIGGGFGGIDQSFQEADKSEFCNVRVKPNGSGAGDLERGTCSWPDFFKCWFCTHAGHGGTWFRDWGDLKSAYWQDSSKRSCIIRHIMIVVFWELTACPLWFWQAALAATMAPRKRCCSFLAVD